MTAVTIRRAGTTATFDVSVSISQRRRHVPVIVIAAIRRTIKISIVSAVPTTAVGGVGRRMNWRREIGIGGRRGGRRWRRRRGRGFVEGIRGNVVDNFRHVKNWGKTLTRERENEMNIYIYIYELVKCVGLVC